MPKDTVTMHAGTASTTTIGTTIAATPAANGSEKFSDVPGPKTKGATGATASVGRGKKRSTEETTASLRGVERRDDRREAQEKRREAERARKERERMRKDAERVRRNDEAVRRRDEEIRRRDERRAREERWRN